jgi:hypothetical protein
MVRTFLRSTTSYDSKLSFCALSTTVSMRFVDLLIQLADRPLTTFSSIKMPYQEFLSWGPVDAVMLDLGDESRRRS